MIEICSNFEPGNMCNIKKYFYTAKTALLTLYTIEKNDINNHSSTHKETDTGDLVVTAVLV